MFKFLEEEEWKNVKEEVNIMRRIGMVWSTFSMISFDSYNICIRKYYYFYYSYFTGTWTYPNLSYVMELVRSRTVTRTHVYMIPRITMTKMSMNEKWVFNEFIKKIMVYIYKVIFLCIYINIVHIYLYKLIFAFMFRNACKYRLKYEDYISKY